MLRPSPSPPAFPLPSAELIGITDGTAARWAALAACDWGGYISDRAR
ncbi:hypothetical protein [Promicromonospora iranensis]|nr:hypothetical protein [Promicromonospora iranensis]